METKEDTDALLLRERKRHWTATGAVLAGALCMLAAAAWGGLDANGPRLLTLFGFLVTALGAAGFIWRMNRREQQLERLAHDLRERERSVVLERDALAETRAAAERELTALSDRLESRHRRLTEQLRRYQEWLEFPAPESMAEDWAPEAATVQRVELDQQVLELLERETQLLFERILANRYSEQGEFQYRLLRDDLLETATKVARIYQPDASEPLLSTSLDQLCRAGNRIFLHLLIVFEDLPLNVKEYNISEVYSYVRTAVKAYGAYKTASPYLGFLNKGMYVGRYLAGTNPLALGAWFVASELGKQGAKAVAKRVLHQQALALLHEVVRIVGYEVAGIYGGNFRYRDPEWVLGVELTRLLTSVPSTRARIREALALISGLSLRNEYDRIYLYHCIANEKAATTRLFDPALMSGELRQKIAGQLEQFLEASQTESDPAKPADVARWREAVEERLQVKLRVAAAGTTQPDDPLAACRSLAEFRMAVQQHSANDALQTLARLKSWTELDASGQQQLREELQKAPPLEFRPPEWDPADNRVGAYLTDLGTLVAEPGDYRPECEQLALEVAAYFRHAPDKMRGRIDAHFVAALAARLPQSVPRRRITPNLARAIFGLELHHEPLRCLYPNAAPRWPRREDQMAGTDEYWIVGQPHRLLLVSVTAPATIHWTGAADVRFERDHGLLIDDALLYGGLWQSQLPEPDALVIPGTMTTSHDTYFAPLKTLILDFRAPE